MATVKLRDGEVSIYTRGDSKNYYAGYRLRGGGRLQESLKTKNKAIAKERALERYDDIKARDKYGLTQNTVSFSHAADSWLLHLKKQVVGGARRPRTVIDYTPAVDRYLKPFFTGKNVDEIKSVDLQKYQTWRNEYWLTGPGAKIKTISYLRQGVEVMRPTNETYRKYPAPRTINGENVILRCILKHAVAQSWMLATQIPKVSQAKLTTSETRKRAYPHFARWEYHKLKRYMSTWVASNTLTEGERWRREAIQDFILILLNSGLREHELFKKDERTHERRGLRWCDVDWFTSKGNVQTVELHVDGKTGERTVICQRPVRVILERRRKLRCPDHKDTDFVMAYPDGSLPSGYDAGLRKLLKSAGLVRDPKTGKYRGIYSARHSYATWRLQEGVSSAIVARNMGTSIEMLDKNYYHHQSRVTADSLMKGMTLVSNE